MARSGAFSRFLQNTIVQRRRNLYPVDHVTSAGDDCCIELQHSQNTVELITHTWVGLFRPQPDFGIQIISLTAIPKKKKWF